MFSKIINFVRVLIEVLTVVGPVIKIPKMEKTIEALSVGVEAYSKTAGNEDEGKRVKAFIKAAAQNAGVETFLKKKINKFTEKQFKKLF